MIIPCVKCGEETDLTELGVSTGHVFDCDGCATQLRVVLFSSVNLGIPEHELKHGQLSVLDERNPWKGGKDGSDDSAG